MSPIHDIAATTPTVVPPCAFPNGERGVLRGDLGVQVDGAVLCEGHGGDDNGGGLRTRVEVTDRS